MDINGTQIRHCCHISTAYKVYYEAWLRAVQVGQHLLTSWYWYFICCPKGNSHTEAIARDKDAFLSGVICLVFHLDGIPFTDLVQPAKSKNLLNCYTIIQHSEEVRQGRVRILL